MKLAQRETTKKVFSRLWAPLQWFKCMTIIQSWSVDQ